MRSVSQGCRRRGADLGRGSLRARERRADDPGSAEQPWRLGLPNVPPSRGGRIANDLRRAPATCSSSPSRSCC